MNRIFAVVIVCLAAALTCIAQTTGPERIDLTPASKADWTGGGPPGGEICGVAQDRRNPQVLYAGTTSGIFKSSSGGDAWVAASNGLPRVDGLCYRLEIDPSQSAILFAEVFGRIYKTIDGGVSWASIDSGLTDSALPTIDPTNPDRIYTVSGDRIFRSPNGGRSWTVVRAAGLPVNEIETTFIVDPSNPAVLYVGSHEGIFKSRDTAESWSPADSGLSDKRISRLAMDPTNSTILYAATSDRVFQSLTSGASWKDMGHSFPGGVQSLIVDPSNPTTLYVATETEVFVMQSGGTWQRITPDVADIVINSFAVDLLDSSTLFTCTWTGLFRSTNAGKTWSVSSSGLTLQNVRQLAVLGPDGRTVFAVGLYGMLFKSANYGDHWDIVSGLPRGRIWAVTADSTGGRMIFTLVDDEIYGSRDAGVTWSLVRIDSSLTAGSLPTLDSSQSTVIRADFRDRILYSLDDGATWSLFKPRLPNPYLSASVWIHPHNSQILFASGLISGLYRSRDGGQTWNQVSEAPGSLGYSLFLDVNQAETMYMLTHEGSFPSHAYKSTDGGFRWEPMRVDASPDGTVEFLAMVPSKPTILFAGIEDDSDAFPRPRTLLKSTDGGASWTVANSGLPSTAGLLGSIASPPGDDAILYLGVAGAGVFKSTDGGEHWRPAAAR
jgi:photosystem II stability/assembly factor-like uncharacterized protein